MKDMRDSDMFGAEELLTVVGTRVLGTGKMKGNMRGKTRKPREKQLQDMCTGCENF